jgi:hypothetical protein
MIDVMVDTETTGTMPDRHALLQIAAVPFNLQTGEIYHQNMFNRCLMLPPFRSWSESTRGWWASQNLETYNSIMARAEEPEVVIKAFAEWSMPANSMRFWSKPSHFDYTFVSSYFNDYGILNHPYHYRNATDMNSWIRARYFPDPVPDPQIELQGAAHDAIYDAIHQIQVLFWHYNNTRQHVLINQEPAT